MMLQTKYKGSMPVGFRQDYFYNVPYINLCKTYYPQDGAIFGPSATVLIKLVEVY